eukprot:14616562-Ditylum_brightwellii.AAC.1
MLEREGHFTSQPQLHPSEPTSFMGLYRHIADPASHGCEKAPLRPRPPDLPRKLQLGSRNLHVNSLPPPNTESCELRVDDYVPMFCIWWQTNTTTGLENHTVNSFFHGNQTRVHCLGETSSNHISQSLPLS